MQNSGPPKIFSYRRRRSLRQRAAASAFLWDILADDLTDRLACTTRSFENCLFLGPLCAQAVRIVGGKAANIVTIAEVEEDHLPAEHASFDLVISAGTLDSVNDIPGALVQIRQSLRPDGLFLGAMFGAGTLGSLKRAMAIADGDIVSPHMHPRVELKAAADLLARTGFAMQVADRSHVEVRYSDWRSLVHDLREAGIGNSLAGPRRYLGHDYIARLDAAWQLMVDSDGKVTERFEFLHLSGWSPSPSQPKPAARGSGTVSLARLLDKSDKG